MSYDIPQKKLQTLLQKASSGQERADIINKWANESLQATEWMTGMENLSMSGLQCALFFLYGCSLIPAEYFHALLGQTDNADIFTLVFEPIDNKVGLKVYARQKSESLNIH